MDSPGSEKFKCSCVVNDKSSLISINSVQSEIASSASLSSIASVPEYDLNSCKQISDVEKHFKELLQKRGPDLIKACRNFDRRSTNKIQKTQLRQVLRHFCFPITAVQFDSLLNEVEPHHSGKLNYMDFFGKFLGGKKFQYNPVLEKVDNVPIEEVELQIKEKMLPKLRDVIRSFWLFDINKDGFIQKAELRRIIKNYCFDLSEQLFDELWKIHDPKATGVLNYKDFLVKLGINAERYKTFISSETVAKTLSWSNNKSEELPDGICDQRIRQAALEQNDDPAIQNLPVEEIEKIFIARLQQKVKVIKKAFSVFDYEKNGEISVPDFRNVINFYLMPMSSKLFTQILKRLGIDTSCSCDCKVEYQDFLERFCYKNGTTTTIKNAMKLDCLPVVQRIKNHVLNPEVYLRSVFTRSSSDQEWQITRQELKRALDAELEMQLTDDEFKELLVALDPGNTNIINCNDFLKLFECPCTNIAEEEKKNLDSYEILQTNEKYLNLRGEKLKSKFKHHLCKNLKNIETALLICDPSRSGYISPEKLLNIIIEFCFPLTYEQFEELIPELETQRDRLKYKEFLDSFKKLPGEDVTKWIGTVNKLVNFKSRCPPELPDDEVEEMFRECVQSRKNVMLKDFKTLDICNVGVICKDDARNVFNKFSFRFNDKQFQELWKKLPRNKFDQLLYDNFLKEFSIPKKLQTQATKDSTKTSNIGETVNAEKKSITSEEIQPKSLKHKKSTDNRKSAKEILYSEAPHLKKIFESIESSIVRNVRTIRYHLHRADPKLSGIVDFSILVDILAKFGIYFSAEEEFFIIEYFDTSLKGKINYKEFLRIFAWYA